MNAAQALCSEAASSLLLSLIVAHGVDRFEPPVRTCQVNFYLVGHCSGSNLWFLRWVPIRRFPSLSLRLAGFTSSPQLAGSNLRFEPTRTMFPSRWPVRTRVRRFGHRFSGSVSFDVVFHVGLRRIRYFTTSSACTSVR